MIFGVDIKFLLAIVAGTMAVAAFFPYFKDVLQGKTKPHIYTWLIWTVTIGTATAGMWYGNGGWGALGFTIGAVPVPLVFLFAIKYGTRNITKGDTIVLIAALLAVVVWWQLRSPLAAVLMVSAIDFLGYIPSFRKTYAEPWTETPVTWAMFTVSDIISVLVLNAYNLLTLTYLVVIIIANSALFTICLLRRRAVPKSALTA